MRIVQIEDFFHPLAGYQVNILSKYFSKKGNEVYIVASKLDVIPDELTSFFGKDDIEIKDKEYEIENNVKIIRVPAIRYISGRVIYENSIFKLIDSLKPDILYVHGNDTFISMQYILKSSKLTYPIITDSHMVEMASKNKFRKLYRLFYRLFITPKIEKYGITVIRTVDSTYIKDNFGISLDDSPLISFGSNTILFNKNKTNRDKMRKELNISNDEFVGIYAGKINESKGGMLLAETLKDGFTINRKLCFIIVGNTSGDYGNKIEEEFKNSKNRIIRIGTQKYKDLAKYYNASDFAVFPKECSLSFFDVQACGLPVIFEDNEINRTRCKSNNAICFTSSNVKDFRNKIELLCNLNNREYEEYSENSIKYILREYDYKDKANEYLIEIEKSVEKYKERNRTN